MLTMPPQHHHSSPGDSDLLSELLSHNAYFDSLVNMIPARLYIAGASGDDTYNPKYGKGQHKESKEARRARNKIAKREKFDPSKMETTLETKRRMQMMENAEDDDEDSDEDGNDNMDMSDDDGEGDTTADANTNSVHPSASSGNTKNANPNNSSATNTTHETQSYASRIEMLRAKLHAKMTEKRALAAGMSVEEYDANNSKVVDGSSATSSTTTMTPTPPALVSKRAARRAEKRKRQEAAKQRNKKNGYSTVIQGNGNNTNAQHQNQQQQQQQQHRMGGNNSHSSPFTKNNSPTTTIITASQDLATIDYQSLAGLKPKLDGALNNKSLIGVTGGDSGSSGLNKKKSLEKLLADAERKQARLRELKASGNEEDKEKARNIEWGETLKVAGGANLRKTNDPKLLKNALKRKAKKKAASAKAWNVRLDQAKDATMKKQQIRSHNIDARKVGGAVGANLSSKRIVEQDGNNDGDGAGAAGGGSGKNNKEKRRRLGPHSGQGQNRAGFEGRKSGFINGGGSKQGGATNGGGGGGAKKG